MKKFLIILVVLAILVPVAAHAFSFVDVINFGSRFFHPKVQAVPTVTIEPATPGAYDFSLYQVNKKFNGWEDAYEKGDVTTVITNSDDLYFTESELNYLITRELASSSNPIAKDLKISLTDNLITVSGYVVYKNLDGQFILELQPIVSKNRLSFSVIKASYRNFYFPPFLAKALLVTQVKPVIDFLYTDSDLQTISITVGSGFLQLNTAE